MRQCGTASLAVTWRNWGPRGTGLRSPPPDGPINTARKPMSLRYRHGPACPGHSSRHGAGLGGPDEACPCEGGGRAMTIELVAIDSFILDPTLTVRRTPRRNRAAGECRAARLARRASRPLVPA